MTQELNPVMLQAQNINLKQKLESAEKRITELQVAVSQHTVHVINPDAGSPPHDGLDSLRAAGAAGTGRSPPSDQQQRLIDSLRKQLHDAEAANQALLRSAAATKAAPAELLVEELDFSRANSTDMSSCASGRPPPPSGAPPPEALQGTSQHQQQLVQEKEDLEKELSRLRAQIATSQADVFKWKSQHTASNNECSKAKRELAETKAQLERAAAANMATSTRLADKMQHDADHVQTIKDLNEDLAAQLHSAQLQLEEALDDGKKQRAASALLSSELEQTKAMLLRSTQKVGQIAGGAKASDAAAAATAALQAEVDRLQAEQMRLRVALEESNSSSSNDGALHARIAELEADAEAAKNAAAEAEFDRLLEGNAGDKAKSAELDDARAQLAARTAERDKAVSEHAIMLKLKDRTLTQLNDTSEELLKSREHFQKREAELLAQLAAAGLGSKPSTPIEQQQRQQRQQQQQSKEEDRLQRERDAAMAVAAAQKQDALQKERDSVQRDRRKQELMNKLQARTREDKATAEEIFNRTAKAYDGLLKNLREAYKDDAGKGQEEVYYEALWEYERKLWHMDNDLKSLQAIVSIRSDDYQSEIAREKDRGETMLTILRMQIHDLGAQPQC